MRYNEVFAGAVVKEGYKMLALINDGDVWHAIIYREGPKDFVYCSYYDITRGDWGQGHYCSTYQQAVAAMVNHLG